MKALGKPQFFGLILIALVSVGLFSHWSGGVVTTIPKAIPQPANGRTLGDEVKVFKTDYFTTNVPSNFITKTMQPSSSGLQRLRILLAPPGGVASSSADQIAITIGPRLKDGVSQLSEVNFRKLPDQKYEKVVAPWVPIGGLSFRRIGESGVEVDTFWQGDDWYASLVVSGVGDRAKQLEQELQSLISSWVWQK